MCESKLGEILSRGIEAVLQNIYSYLLESFHGNQYKRWVVKVQIRGDAMHRPRKILQMNVMQAKEDTVPW